MADLGVWDLPFGTQNGQPGGLLFPAHDRVFEQRFGTPIVLAGRMWNPSAPDQVVVTEALAKGGFPLGIAVGRTCWHWVAERVPLEDVPPLALIAVLLTVPAAILVVNALAVWPGRSVARLHPADLLRSE